jgi:anti-sigma factor RsiW
VSCPDFRDLLHGYADGELDLVHTLRVEQHLRDCPACARACEGLRSLHAALQADAVRFAPPAGLARRVRFALRGAAQRQPPTRRFRLLAAAAALALLVAGGAWGVARLRTLPAEQELLAREVVGSHVRSLMAAHLFDIPSTNRHVVKPWFDGKLDFSPPVVDLAAHRFPLQGGRLDYVNGRAVAALVYHRRLHVINLLIWPAAGGDTPPRAETRQGYHLVSWAKGGMAFWAVSDLNSDELNNFVQLLQDRLPAAGP